MSVTLAVTFGQRSGSNWVEDTTDYSTTLKLVEINSLYSQQAPASTDSHGNWLFTNVADGIYRFELSSSILTKYGTFKIGCSDAILTTGIQTKAGVLTLSSQSVFTGGLKSDTIAENSTGAGVTIDGILLKDSLAVSDIATATDLDALELLCEDFTNKDTGFNQNIYRQWTLITVPYITGTVTAPFHAANAKYVQDYVNAYLTGSVSAGQQSPNEIIVDYNGTVEANKRYTNIDAALSSANSYADSLTRMVLYIEGNGIGTEGVELDTNYNLLTVSYDDYVDVKGIVQSCIVKVEDDTYITTTIGQKIIENVTLQVGSTATTSFTNFIFKNVKFYCPTNDSTISLIGCILDNCTQETITITLTTCKGKITDLTNSRELLLQDCYDKTKTYQTVYANGDIRGKRILGRVGSDVASASSITLGEGNLFNITGTTTINLMLVTNWTAGSRITLVFGSNVTVNQMTASSGSYMPFFWKSGVNKNVLANEVHSFILSKNSDVWLED